KFGVAIADAVAACARIRELRGLRLTGVAVHIGSQITSLAPLEAAFERLGRLIGALRTEGHEIRTADLGGGLGLAYDPAAPPPPTAGDYGAMVERATKGWGCRLIFEPGRLLVGHSGVLLTSVIRIKPGPALPFVIVDAAMNDLMRPTLYDAWHAADAVAPNGEHMVADIVGPICETGDTFARARRIDRVAAGDLMILRTAGAYAATMGSTYNSRPLAPEVLVNGASWAVIRERPAVEDLPSGYRVPLWLRRPAGGEGRR
ncbi:MAG TPA: diaminopimelate decarboxylase, partial [Allosphingosinicella sp.]